MTSERRVAVPEALERCGLAVRESGAGWHGQFPGERPLRVSVRLQGHWLLVRAEGWTAPPELTSWDFLCLNGRLTALTKLGRAGGAVELRAEVRAREDAELAPRLAEVCDALRASQLLLKEFEPLATPVADQLDVVAGGRAQAIADPLDRLEAIVRDRHRSCKRRSDGRLIVRLDTAHGIHQATIRAQGEAGRISTDLIVDENLTEPSREALGEFLLAASAQLLMLRGAVELRGGQAVVVFEGFCTPACSATDVDHALAGLAAGCDAFAQEATALTHEGLARTYLTHTHHGGGSCSSQTIRQSASSR